MAQPPEIVTDFSWRRSLGAILSAQLQDKVCKGRGAGNAENFSSGRRRRAAGPELGHLQEGVENLWRTGKEVTLRLPESPFFSGNPSNAYRKLSPVIASRKSAFKAFSTSGSIACSSGFRNGSTDFLIESGIRKSKTSAPSHQTSTHG